MKCLRPIVAFVVHQGLYVSPQKDVTGGQISGVFAVRYQFFLWVYVLCVRILTASGLSHSLKLLLRKSCARYAQRGQRTILWTFD